MMIKKIWSYTACINKINSEANKYFKKNSGYFQEVKISGICKYNMKSLGSQSVCHFWVDFIFLVRFSSDRLR